MSGALRIERVVTSGVFELDGGTWNVDNNVWLIGDDHDVVVVDAAHDDAPIVEAVGNRRVAAIVCTHGHNDHISVAPQLGDRLDAPVLLHPAESHSGENEMAVDSRPPTVGDDPPEPNVPGDGRRRTNRRRGDVAGTTLEVIPPGHSPGSVCLHLSEAHALFSGDTLFAGGPGATGRSFSDFPTIITSIRDLLFPLGGNTLVHTGHGDTTTIQNEAPHLDEWIRRGH
ncbi:MBL fold metallo-hydrolase [Streptomyces sp. NPDC020792]|uniref:MBL fold metallo-hydrolase n=1 Tax=Streptomyces sp. NPDC020792 TaxID=3365089 RepID=UPI0037AB0BC7